MAVKANLGAKLRDGRGKGAARRLRREGRVPAVIYGHGEETRALSVDAHELEQLMARVSVENTVLTLRIEEDGGREVRALVREVQMDPVRPRALHVDFYQVHAGERVDVEIPIRLTGAPAGVKAGGILQQTLNDLEIRCLAEAIPESVEADVSGLEIGDSLHVRDLAIPAGAEVRTDAGRTVCSVLEPTVRALEEEPEAPEGVGGEVEPELIRRRAEEGELPPATEQGGHE